MEREESWPGTVTPLWTVPLALSTASLQPAVLCKRAPAHAVAAAARTRTRSRTSGQLAAPTRVSPTATTE